MKTISRLVFISAFVGMAHAALIVPFWQQLEESEEPKLKSPELKKLEEPAELEKTEELFGDPDLTSTNLSRKVVNDELITRFWKSLSHNKKAMVVAILRSPQFYPFGPFEGKIMFTEARG